MFWTKDERPCDWTRGGGGGRRSSAMVERREGVSDEEDPGVDVMEEARAVRAGGGGSGVGAGGRAKDMVV